MPRKKPYNDGCATAHALDIIGERWALLIVRELVPGPKRFSDIKDALPGISTNVLTNRLAELEASHVLVRKRLPPPAASQVFELTQWGSELEPLIREIGRWAARSPDLSPGKPMSAASVMLSFRTMFSPEKAADSHLRLALIFDGVPYRAIVDAGTLDIRIGQIENPDVTVAGAPTTLAGLVYGGLTLSDVKAAGLSVTGNENALLDFAGLFPLPEKAARTAEN